MIKRNLPTHYFVSCLFAITGMLFFGSCAKRYLESPLSANAPSLNATTGMRSLVSNTIGSTLRVTTYAGSGNSTFANGNGTAASFHIPEGVAMDAAGNIYVADAVTNRIRKITPFRDVTTFAGNGIAGTKDGAGDTAQFNTPVGVATDAAGNVYVADRGNHQIRKITPAGIVTTLAGSGQVGNAEGPGLSAQFSSPSGVAVDAAGNVYVADMGNNKIRKITPAGLVNTYAGNGNPGFGEGPPAFAQFSAPVGVAFNPSSGILYVADKGNNRIRKITNGVTGTLAGTGVTGNADGAPGVATFDAPAGVAVDAFGAIYITDHNNRVRKATAAGIVSAYAGGGTTGILDGEASVATFISPIGMVVDPSGNVFVADAQNERIREIGFYTMVSTFAGNGSATSSNGPALSASFYFPADITKDAAGNLYIADYYNHMIRKITPAGSVSTLAGATLGPWSGAFLDGQGAEARFNGPSGVAIDASGTLYVSDLYNNRIRKITPAGMVSTLAGNFNAGYSEGAGAAATFNAPTSVALDAAGNVYVSDYYNHRIRKVTPSGMVSTLAGSGIGYASGGFAEGPGITAKFNYPMGLAVDASGNVYVADAQNHRIRKVTPEGVVSTVAGTGMKGFLDGTIAVAQFNGPSAVKLDAAGNLFVVDQGNKRIRLITTLGQVSTLAGNGGGGIFGGYADGPGNLAQFAFPGGLEVNADGTLYIADTWNNRIRIIQ